MDPSFTQNLRSRPPWIACGRRRPVPRRRWPKKWVGWPYAMEKWRASDRVPGKNVFVKLKMMVSRGFTIVSHEKLDDCSIKHRDKRVCRFQTGSAENHSQLPVANLLRTPAVCSPTKISDSSLPSLIPLKPSLEAGPSWNSKTIVGWEELPQLRAD